MPGHSRFQDRSPTAGVAISLKDGAGSSDYLRNGSFFGANPRGIGDTDDGTMGRPDPGEPVRAGAPGGGVPGAGPGADPGLDPPPGCDLSRVASSRGEGAGA